MIDNNLGGAMKEYFTFAAGMTVKVRHDVHFPFFPHNGVELTVKAVSDFCDCCDCGRRDSAVGHSPRCISLTWGMDAGHPQQVIITDPDGGERKFSGYWFEPVN